MNPARYWSQTPSALSSQSSKLQGDTLFTNRAVHRITSWTLAMHAVVLLIVLSGINGFFQYHIPRFRNQLPLRLDQCNDQPNAVSKKLRIDEIMVSRSLAHDINEAKALVMSGSVLLEDGEIASHCFKTCLFYKQCPPTHHFAWPHVLSHSCIVPHYESASLQCTSHWRKCWDYLFTPYNFTQPDNGFRIRNPHSNYKNTRVWNNFP